MTDRPLGTPASEQPEGLDDRTRDIRLPPLQGRPPAQVPGEWTGAGGAQDASASEPPARERHLHEPPLQEIPVREIPVQPPPVAGPAVVGPAVAGPPVAGPPVAGPPVVEPAAAEPPDSTSVLEPRTDHVTPVAAPPRQETRPFGAPGDHALHAPSAQPDPSPPQRAAHAAYPDASPPAARAGRAWTWVLLVILPIVIIAAAGVLLYVLLSGS
ncbi:MAG: hypothetical protein JWQ45_2529 [Blastococcus sp.]|nr:hypothetical protein [Blastococcus sp.]